MIEYIRAATWIVTTNGKAALRYLDLSFMGKVLLQRALSRYPLTKTDNYGVRIHQQIISTAMRLACLISLGSRRPVLEHINMNHPVEEEQPVTSVEDVYRHCRLFRDLDSLRSRAQTGSESSDVKSNEKATANFDNFYLKLFEQVGLEEDSPPNAKDREAVFEIFVEAFQWQMVYVDRGRLRLLSTSVILNLSPYDRDQFQSLIDTGKYDGRYGVYLDITQDYSAKAKNIEYLIDDICWIPPSMMEAFLRFRNHTEGTFKASIQFECDTYSERNKRQD